ncbi:MAG: TolC family protein [Elusimicrobia bacterium]|nr:TolC family protein [Elusimicrobiota bacterium]MDY6040132.1 TolC family protein [Elusimicrobiaceae bacterium]
MKKYCVLALALLCAALPAAAQKEYGLKFSSLINDDLTLENAIRLGLENNSEFLSARQEIIIAEQKINEAKFRFLPQFSLQGTATWYDLEYPMVLPDAVANRFLPSTDTLNEKKFFGVGVTATQYLYSGGRIRGTLKMARANLKQVQSRYETVKNAVVLDIKKSFNNLLHAQEYARFTQQTLDTANQWYARPSGDAWTQIRQRALLADLALRNNQAKRALGEAQMSMLVSLNKELNSTITIKGDFVPVKTNWDLPHLNLWAMEFRPELKSAIYALEADNISIDLALSKRYPDIILNGSYEQMGADTLEDVNKQISLAVRLPIPYNFSEQIAQKKAEQRKSSLRRAAIEDKIRIQVAGSFESMRFWQDEVLERQAVYRDLKTRIETAGKTAAKTGISPLEALLAYEQTAAGYFEAVLKNRVAKAELEWAIGQDLQ